MSLKGEVSTWIWIAAVTVVGVIIFTAGMNILHGYMRGSERESDSNEFSNIISNIKFVCQEDAENIYPYDASFSKQVKAIYSSNVIEEPPDKISVLISREDRSLGDYVCIRFFDDDKPYCEKIFCDVDMRYLGAPSLEETLASKVRNAFGGGETYKYDIIIEKGRDGIVYLDAEDVMPVEVNNLCGNGDLDIGEECDSNTDYCEPLYGACSRLSCVSCMCEASLDCDYCSGEDEYCVEGSDWTKYCMQDISECYDNTAETYLIPQGLYDYCDIGTEECLSHLDELGEAGFELILCYSSGFGNSESEINAYLDRAEANGIKVIWDFNELIGTSNAPTTAVNVVEIIKDHPALWGYYVGDENEESQAGEIKATADAVKNADPNHPRLYVDYRMNMLDPFVDSCDVMGIDIYPIGESTNSEASVALVGSMAKDLQEYNDEHNKQTMMVLQAFNWADDANSPDWDYRRWPTRDEMRQMRDQALENSDSVMILWFAYYYNSPGQSHWDDLVWAAMGDK